MRRPNLKDRKPPQKISRRSPILEIEAERRRQIEDEGWDAAHDDEHAGGEMLHAATFYYLHATGQPISLDCGVPVGWPWDAKWWKPKNTRRDLVRAGALCLAERDRLERATPGCFKGNVNHKLRLIVEALRRC